MPMACFCFSFHCRPQKQSPWTWLYIFHCKWKGTKQIKTQWGSFSTLVLSSNFLLRISNSICRHMVRALNEIIDGSGGRKKKGKKWMKSLETKGMSWTSPSYLQMFLPVSINPSNFRIGYINYRMALCTERLLKVISVISHVWIARSHEIFVF